MKKILVSGCANCPYLTLWNDGKGNGAESLVHGTCKYSGWSKELPNPSFEVNGRLILAVVKDNEIFSEIDATYTPKWCPLSENN